MNGEEKEIKTLVKYIIDAIDKKIEFLKCDREAIVLEVNGDYCTVLINNAKYKVKNGTAIEFQINDKCLVHFINGNQQRKIIIAKL